MPSFSRNSLREELNKVSPQTNARNLPPGEKLGVVGHSGLTYGMHCYFEMLRDGRPVDPAPYLGVPLCKGGAHHTAADGAGPKSAWPVTTVTPTAI